MLWDPAFGIKEIDPLDDLLTHVQSSSGQLISHRSAGVASHERVTIDPDATSVDGEIFKRIDGASGFITCTCTDLEISIPEYFYR